MISDHSFAAITDLFHRVSGIRLTDAKRALVVGRLQKLAHERGEENLDGYVENLLRHEDPEGLARLVDKLTTNETYFFREPAHFDHLDTWLNSRRDARRLRVWSAASSSGEEAYSIAMLLADRLGLNGWEVVGTDLSSTVVATARRGLYPLDRARNVPPHFLKRWCLKGHGEYENQLLIDRELRHRVHFEQANLTQALPEIGSFEIIFLRNVLIYFDNPGKVHIVRRVLQRLVPGGLLYTGHAESIGNLGLPITAVASAVYTHEPPQAACPAFAPEPSGGYESTLKAPCVPGPAMRQAQERP